MRLVTTVFVLLGLCGSASADTVVLKNGTTLEGEIETADKTLDRIVMKVKVGSSSAKLTLKYSDVVKLEFSSAEEEESGSADGPFTGRRRGRTGPKTGPDVRKPPRRRTAAPITKTPRKKKRVTTGAAPRPTRPTTKARRIPGPKTTGRTTPMRAAGKRVVYLVDASGSMGIGKRWEQATEQLQKMIERLKDKTPFDVMLFHDTCFGLFTNNNTLTKTPKSGYRTAKRMRETEPDMRRGTNLYHALIRAMKRTPKKIVVITDGILTRGGPYGANHALRKVREAREKGIGVDFFCAQDGTYQAPEVEKKGAARQLLSRYAREGRGIFLTLPNKTKRKEALPTTFKPLPGTVDGTAVPWRIEVLAPRRYRDLKHWEAQWKVIKGHIPGRFRVRVWDPRVNRGEYLDVWEYGGAIWLDVYTGSGKVLNLRFHRSSDKQTLVTDREIRIVSHQNPRLKGGGLAFDKRFAFVGSNGGGVTLVYRRGNESFKVNRTTEGSGRSKDRPLFPPGRRPILPPKAPRRAPTLPPETELARAQTD